MADKFKYVIHIRSTPEEVFNALFSEKSVRECWCGCWHDCAWTKGASWKLMIPDGRIGDAGEVLEIDAPHHLVLSWRNEFIPEMKAEEYSRCTVDLVTSQGAVKLTLTHEMERENSKLIAGVSEGWPGILCSVKSFLETGEPLEETKRWPEGM